MDTLRVLVVGNPEHLETITAALSHAGHTVMATRGLEEAAEALLIQRFDAILLGGQLPPGQVAALTSKVKELDKRSTSGSRTAILSVVPGATAPEETLGGNSGVDGFIGQSVDPDTLTLAIARLASAIGTETVRANSGDAPLPILDVEQLKEQVAYDDELLVELIDLFLSERIRQSQEMSEALAKPDYELLSRVAHTIKGSLGSLHAIAAKANAQALELAAKEHDGVKSQSWLAALEADLDALEDALMAVRRSVTSS